MQQVLKAFLLLLGLAIIVCGIGFLYFINTGVSAKEKPGRVEEFVAGRSRYGDRPACPGSDESHQGVR